MMIIEVDGLIGNETKSSITGGDPSLNLSSGVYVYDWNRPSHSVKAIRQNGYDYQVLHISAVTPLTLTASMESGESHVKGPL